MFSGFQRSLMLRVGFALALIAAFALFGIVSSVIIAETLRGEATAINRAGALRMQTYSISTDLLQPRSLEPDVHRQRVESGLRKFEERYASEPLTRIVPSDPAQPARAAYEEVGLTWEQQVKPAILRALENPSPSAPDVLALRDELDVFVDRIDNLVRLLEQRTESKVQLLRFTQGMSLFLTLVVIFITMYFIRNDVLQPLRDLLRAAEAVRRRDFTWRIQHTGPDELGQLGATFNLMARDLSQTYEELEARVSEKTGALERSKRSLELMYRSLMHLHESSLTEEDYAETLGEVERFLGLGSGSICMVEEDGRKGFRLASTWARGSSGGAPCSLESCQDCIEEGHTRLSRVRSVTRADGRGVLTVPLRDGNRIHGLLTMQVPEGLNLDQWQIRLVEAVAQHLATSIGRQRTIDQQNRLALLEERATIARELHDSLAQALSYLKIEVSRLQGMAQQPGREFEIQATLRDVREGLNDAYRQLRELLTTFRIRMDDRGLHDALETTVREFAERGKLSVRLQNLVAEGQLEVNAEIHVLQLVREALSNVVKHAQARTAWVSLQPLPDGRIRVAVEDDGRGIPRQVPEHGHYGLAIMRERARNLGGALKLKPGSHGGTSVVIEFDPAVHRGLYTRETPEATNSPQEESDERRDAP
jgi:two-component system, NarL family, nitrate/nitrite sensor histidine kinase NarX